MNDTKHLTSRLQYQLIMQRAHDYIVLTLYYIVGPLAAPAGPAFVYFLILQDSLIAEGRVGPVVVVVPTLAAITLEVLGLIASAGTSLFLARKQYRLAAVCAGLGSTYLIVGLVGLWIGDKAVDAKVIDTGLFMVTIGVYAVSALATRAVSDNIFAELDEANERAEAQRQRQLEQDAEAAIQAAKVAAEVAAIKQAAQLTQANEQDKHARKLAKRNGQANEPANERTHRTNADAPLVSNGTAPKRTPGRRRTPAENIALMTPHYRPGIGPTELANLAGVGKSTAHKFIGDQEQRS